MSRAPLRIGLISDVHAQLPALHRAFGRVAEAEVDRVVCLGDVVEKGPDGDAVVEALAGHLVPTVCGNHDHNAVRHADLGGGGLSAASVAWLRALPDTREYLWAGRFVQLAHGSPVDRGLGVIPGDVPKSVRRALRRGGPDVLVLGHTHRPMRMRFGGCWIVNPGSVWHGRCGLGPTCGVLTLPEVRLEVCLLESGRWIALEAE